MPFRCFKPSNLPEQLWFYLLIFLAYPALTISVYPIIAAVGASLAYSRSTVQREAGGLGHMATPNLRCPRNSKRRGCYASPKFFHTHH